MRREAELEKLWGSHRSGRGAEHACYRQQLQQQERQRKPAGRQAGQRRWRPAVTFCHKGGAPF